ncbi:MAG: hypothetical protein ACLSCU_00610 [Eubacterium sp.]
MKMERRVIVSRQNNKQQIEEKKPGYLYLPLALAVAVVPLIAVAALQHRIDQVCMVFRCPEIYGGCVFVL